MKWLYLSAVTVLISVLLLSGCGSNSDEACAYKVEQDLDHGEYDAVIAELENGGTCNGALSQNAAWTNLAGAYLGKAGISLGGLAANLLGDTSADPMAAFLTAFGDIGTTNGLQNLTNATTVYGYIRLNESASFTSCNNITGASAVVVDSCFYEELANTVKTVSIMSSVLGGALEFLSTEVVSGSIDDVNENNNSDELEVTGCAIGDANATVSLMADTVCNNDDGSLSLEFNSTAPVLFSNGHTLTPMNFTVTASGAGLAHGDQSYYRLINHEGLIPSPVSTSGACTLSLATCSTIDNVNCFPCPIVVDGEPVNSTEVILDAINTGALGDSLTVTDVEQACWDAEEAAGITGVNHVCVVNSDLTDLELAQYMTLQ